ncbi:erythromycin esterase family protein [Nonomuraea sp. NPDC049421]|uniref:erythromycin esterase family protein n=1 Tax=Nonomuraea sp. NPDC049421 TaxID=3155275 RepID=UPI003446E13A
MTNSPYDGLLRLLPARPRLLALGEPTHGDETLLGLRNELVRRLVEQEGYRCVAIESDCVKGLVVDDHVTSGAGNLSAVMAGGFSHGAGAAAGNRELVRWLRAYNRGRPAADRVRFAGFDAPMEMTHAASPRQALTALHAYLGAHADTGVLPETLDRLLGPDERWTDEQAIFDPSRSIGRSDAANELRLLADDLACLLDVHAPGLVAAGGRDAWERARLYARTATGLLRYHAQMAGAAPGRVNAMMGLRDAMMAANLLALADRGPTLVHAHNRHLQRQRSTVMLGELRVDWWSAGAQVARRLGDAYAFVATAVGTIHHEGVGAPPPDTVEGVLHAMPGDRFLIAGRELDATGLVPRDSPWYGYLPLTPADLTGSDALLYVRDLPPGP